MDAPTDPHLAEAAALIARTLDKYRSMPSERLRLHVDHQIYCEELAASGAKYGLLTDIFWDDKRATAVRVFVDASRYASGQWSKSIASDDTIIDCGA